MGKKRDYTMSERALEQRRRAAKRSTGPRSDEGKARVSRNAWVHGEYSEANRRGLLNGMLFGKPCKTSCPIHPDNPDHAPEHPCSLVLEGHTSAGGDCLDKTVYVDAFNAIIRGMQEGDFEQVNAMAAAQTAGAIETLHQIKQEIENNGPAIEQDIFDKEGKPVGSKMLANPVLPFYVKMLDALGINLGEMMATPKARDKLVDSEDPDDPVLQMFQALAQASGDGRNKPVRRPETVDGEFTEGEVGDGEAD